jgi:hypothetical protein
MGLLESELELEKSENLLILAVVLTGMAGTAIPEELFCSFSGSIHRYESSFLNRFPNLLSTEAKRVEVEDFWFSSGSAIYS